ncbi:MAG: FAD-binding protein [Bacteroidetes bacterium]|nr:FAD-binding protein [Bacteroidota bacterium]MDA1122209.1 FAD-binding protein [Bacteroidota bacterium]
MKSKLKSRVQAQLQQLLGDRVSTNQEVLDRHGEAFSLYERHPPDFVVFPKSEEEIVSIVELCSHNQIPIIPFGAGTSIGGHILALHGGICIDVTLMNEIIEVNYEDMYVTVQPGVTRNQLDERLEGSDFFFPIGPAVNATIGGMASTRASGTNAVRYGTMRENVLDMVAILPNGEKIRTGSKAKKSSTGYDLTRLFVGSEGTLGVITELTLKLYCRPERIYSARCSFPSIEAAVNTTIKIIQTGVPVCKIELVDGQVIEAINAYSGLSNPAVPTLFFEFHGTEIELDDHIRKTRKHAEEQGGHGFLMEKEESKQKKLWQARRDLAPSVMARFPGSTLMTTDVCVPISRLAECIVETEKDFKEAGLFPGIHGHVGDGNFHLAIPLYGTETEDYKMAKVLNKKLIKRGLAMGGTSSGEHGIGIEKLSYMKEEHGSSLEVMRAIKAAIDPENIMNPGKLIPDK